MIANAELAGIIKPALPVEAYISLKQNRTGPRFSCLFQGIVQQCLSIALSLQLRCDADRSHREHRDRSSVICLDDGPHEHVLSDQIPILLHDEIQLLYESRIIPQHMDHIVLTASRTIHIPECFSDKFFNCTVFFFSFQTNHIVIFIHYFSS